MRILNVAFTTKKGGLEQAFLDYSQALSLQNNEVIAVLHPNSYLTTRAKSEIYHLKPFSKHDPIAILKMAMLIRNKKPDVIITHGNRAHHICNIASKIALKKNIRIGVCHGDSLDYITQSDYVISVSKDLIPKLIHNGTHHDKIIYMPNMINLETDKKATKHPSTNKAIGLIGRLDDDTKGVDLLIKALSKLKSGGINIKAIIGGDGVEKEKLLEMIAEHNLQNQIEMVGWVTDKEKFFNAVDVLCVPSRYEVFGIVILEAMKYGAPVIASDVSGPSEIITHNKDGLLFKSEDTEDLAAKIKELFSSDELWTKLYNNGSKTVQQYDISKVSKQLNDTIATWVKGNK